MTKKTVTHAFSTGGIVFRAGVSGIEIALVGRTRDNIWTLPKGTPHEGESRDQTALREVREETGLETRIVDEVGLIEYSFSRRGRLFKKQVFHYLMLATGGNLEAHDHEYDEARWFSLEEALARLSHENESDIVRSAEPLIHAWLEQKDSQDTRQS